MAAIVTSNVIEALMQKPSTTRVSGSIVEILISRPTTSPTTVTGGGVTQDVIEVLWSPESTSRVTQSVIEILCSFTDIEAVIATVSDKRSWATFS